MDTSGRPQRRLAQLCLNIALLIIIEAALYGAFLWAHGPNQQFVQRKTQMTDQPNQPSFVWVVVKRHGFPIPSEQVIGTYKTKSDAAVARDVFQQDNIDPLAKFEVQPREA